MKIIFLLTVLFLCIVINTILWRTICRIKRTLASSESIIMPNYDLYLPSSDNNTKQNESDDDEEDEELNTRKGHGLQDSRFMSFLNSLAIKDQIYICSENWRHTNTVTADHHDAYLYVIAESEKESLLVFESIMEDCATYIIWISRWYKKSAIKNIIGFFESEEINKRDTIRKANRLNMIKGVNKYIPKQHQNIEDWKTNILWWRNSLQQSLCENKFKV